MQTLKNTIGANQIETGDKIVLKDYSVKEITSSKLNRREEVIRICYDGYCVRYSYDGKPVDPKWGGKEIIGVLKPRDIWSPPFVQPRKNEKYALLQMKNGDYKMGWVDDCSFYDEFGDQLNIKQEVKRWVYLDRVIEILEDYEKNILK